MFGQSNATRGPIALSEDDLEGATGIDWEELDAQLEEADVDGELTPGTSAAAAGAGTGRGMDQLLKPMSKQTRFADNGTVDQEEVEPYRTTSTGENDAPYVDDDGTDDLEAELLPSKSVPREERLFKLDDEESEHEN